MANTDIPTTQALLKYAQTLGKSTSSRAVDPSNGVGRHVKTCRVCGEEMYVPDARRTKAGNLASFCPKNPAECVGCENNYAGPETWRKNCISCSNAAWKLAVNPPRMEGGSKRGTALKGKVNNTRQVYVLQGKESTWIRVQGPCQAVQLGIDARPWDKCRKCYVAGLKALAKQGIGASIVTRKAGTQKLISVREDETRKREKLNALNTLRSMGKEIKEKTKKTVDKPIPEALVVKTYQFCTTVVTRDNVFPVVVEARHTSEARKLISEQIGKPFAGDIFKRLENGDFQRMI